MPSVERSYTIVSIAWNGNTWNATNGGPLGFSLGHPGRTILDRTADDQYSPCVIIPEKDIQLSIRLRQISLLDVPGAAKSDVVIVIKVAGRPDTTYTLTVHDMVLADPHSGLQRSVPGEMTLNFVHEHGTDGITKA